MRGEKRVRWKEKSQVGTVVFWDEADAEGEERKFRLLLRVGGENHQKQEGGRRKGVGGQEIWSPSAWHFDRSRRSKSLSYISPERCEVDTIQEFNNITRSSFSNPLVGCSGSGEGSTLPWLPRTS